MWITIEVNWIVRAFLFSNVIIIIIIILCVLMQCSLVVCAPERTWKQGPVRVLADGRRRVKPSSVCKRKQQRVAPRLSVSSRARYRFTGRDAGWNVSGVARERDRRGPWIKASPPSLEYVHHNRPLVRNISVCNPERDLPNMWYLDCVVLVFLFSVSSWCRKELGAAYRSVEVKKKKEIL